MTKVNRRICMLLAAMLLFLCVALYPTPAQAIPAFEEATIIADGVNMRLRPTVDSPFVLKLETGTRVGVFCEEVDGWYRIIYGNYRGYVSKDFVFLPSTDVLVGNVIEDGTAVYANAGEFSEPVDTLNAGTGVQVTSVLDEYYGVEYTPFTSEEEQPAAETESPAPPPEETGGAEADTADADAVLAQGNAARASEPEEAASGIPESSLENASLKKGYIRKDTVNLSASKNAANMIREGMTGVEVTKMQRELKNRGFMGASATGEFGKQTKKAVILFQEMAGLQADGIAGAQTLEMLYGDNDITCTYAQRMGISGTVQLMPWDEAKDLFYKGATAKITDVATGISWYDRRFGGWFHADSEPVSAADTAKMKEAYGGSWSWDRRAVWITIDGVTIAGSINGMPHLSSTIGDNNFPGHHCIHVYQSKVHENSAECPRHQSQVQYAYKMGQE
ncbi:MAG: peptidoglycan-binding protein [Christensenellaceae bacterium]